ncbi:MAG: hypothetical protein ABIH36_03580 [bacterium]
MISWLRRSNNNNLRDSLFNLPLFPPQPNSRTSLVKASQNLTNDTNQCITDFSVAKARRQLAETSEKEWQSRGERRALALFHAAAEHVPAYKDFLKKNQVRPEKIKTIDDFKKLPLIDKENYLQAYPLNELAWYGELSSSQIISCSSGSSGRPTFWPRGQILEAETVLEHELFLTTFFHIDSKPTLFLNCFSMGMYVAGVITLNSVMRIGQKGYPVTIVTPGIYMDDIVRIIPDLSIQFRQIILAGYPPFIKDILDEGTHAGIDWSKLSIKFLLAGEGYSEMWRKHISKIVQNGDPIHDFINLYGSADAAVLAHETPTSIVTRSRLAEDSEAKQKLFASELLPSLLQYHPEHKFFEQVDKELIFTTPGGVPLVRYNIHDKGGVLTQKDFIAAVPRISEYYEELKCQNELWDIPFVYTFGKSDATVMLYGLNIYPENIKNALESEALKNMTTGRFAMSSEYSSNMDQYLLINIELADKIGLSSNLTQDFQDVIVATLKKKNREYQKLFSSIRNKALPVIRLHKKGKSDLFTRAGKQRWIRLG